MLLLLVSFSLNIKMLGSNPIDFELIYVGRTEASMLKWIYLGILLTEEILFRGHQLYIWLVVFDQSSNHKLLMKSMFIKII